MKMKAKRLSRYKTKLELLGERVEDTEKWLSGLNYEKFLTSPP